MSHSCDNLKIRNSLSLNFSNLQNSLRSFAYRYNIKKYSSIFIYLGKAHDVKLRIECRKPEDFERFFRKGECSGSSCF